MSDTYTLLVWLCGAWIPVYSKLYHSSWFLLDCSSGWNSACRITHTRHSAFPFLCLQKNICSSYFLNERIQKFTKQQQKNPQKYQNNNKTKSQCNLFSLFFSSFGFKYLIFKYSLLLGSSAFIFKSQGPHECLIFSFTLWLWWRFPFDEVCVCHLCRFSGVRHPVWPLEELLHQWGEWPERCLHHRPWARARVSTFPYLKSAPSACSHAASSTCIPSSNGAVCFSSLILERPALWVLFVIRARSDGCTDQQTSQRSRAWDCFYSPAVLAYMISTLAFIPRYPTHNQVPPSAVIWEGLQGRLVHNSPTILERPTWILLLLLRALA